MKRLQEIFREVPIGSVCTGTVHLYKLDSKKLQKQKIIEQRAHRVKLDGNKESQLVTDYFFLGISDDKLRTEKKKVETTEEEDQDSQD